MASAVNNAVARAAGLIAVTVLPLLAGLTGAAALQPHHFAAGFRVAIVIAGCTCVAGGLLAAATIRNPSGGWRQQARSATDYNGAAAGLRMREQRPPGATFGRFPTANGPDGLVSAPITSP